MNDDSLLSHLILGKLRLPEAEAEATNERGQVHLLMMANSTWPRSRWATGPRTRPAICWLRTRC